MASIGTLRRALADLLAASFDGYEVYATAPGTLTTPCMVVEVAGGEITTMGRGACTYRFDVSIVVGMGEALDEAQDALDDILSNDDGGIFALFDDDADLNLSNASGLAYVNASALTFSGYGPETIGEQVVLRATVPVTIHTRNT